MSRTWVRCLLAVPSLLLLSAAAPRQKPLIPRTSETVEVSIVNLDVVVTDKAGNRVRGLTAADFDVFEDGKRQAISNFAEYGPNPVEAPPTSAAERSATEPAAAPRDRRTIVVFVDRFWLAEFHKEAAFGSLKTLLREVVRPGDAVLIANWRSRVVVKQEFTDDLAAIERAIDEIAREYTGVTIDRSQQLQERQAEMNRFAQEVAAAAGSRAAFTGLDFEGFTTPRVGLEAQRLAEIDFFEMKQKVAAANALIGSMAGIEGRKALIVFTHRLGRMAGYEYFIGSVSAAVHPYYERLFDTREVLGSLTRTANAHGVTIYPLYPEGLRRSFDSNAALNGSLALDLTRGGRGGFDYLVLGNEIEGLTKVASQTGGVAAWGGVNIAEAVPRLRDDFESYYSLAYRLPARNDDKARRIEVKTKDRRLAVRTRREFVERSPEGRMSDRVRAHLVREPEPSAIPIRVSIGAAVKKESRLFAIPVTVRIPVNSLTLLPQDGTRRGAFSVYVGSARLVGEPPSVKSETFAFTADDVAKVKGPDFTYAFELLTDFATHRLSVGVIDEVSRDTGFAAIDLRDTQPKAAPRGASAR